jgi:succinyl-diaminopimelate desuccinylase
VIILSEELILKEIENNKEEYIEFLRELIKSESYNPPGNEKIVALKIEEYLKKINIKCEIYPFGDNRANLIAFLNDDFNGRNLLFNGHMDVVPPGSEADWKYPPLSATVKRNKFMYGRGTADMKGGLAAMVVSLKILKKLNMELSGNLILNTVADEETGGKYGTKWCLDNKLQAFRCDFAIVGETTGFDPLSKAIILGEKGRVQIKIHTNGISCHASAPFLGKNAIYMMSDIIQNFDKLDNMIPNVDPPIPMQKLKKLMCDSFPNEKTFDKIYSEQPLLPNVMKALTQFTKSLTLIHAGIKANVVPDHCTATIDFRLLPGQTTQMLINALKKLISDIGYEVKDEPAKAPNEVYVYLEIEEESEASFWNDWEKSEDIRNLYEIINKAYNKKPFYFLFPASTDANFLRNSNYCPKTVVFGPGSASLTHVVNEYLEIDDFINAIKVYTLFAYNYLKKGS